MSVKYTIDTSEKVVLVTFAGEIEDSDLIEIGPATKAHPLFDPSFSELVDFSAVTGGTVSRFAVRILARRPRTSKHGVIAPQPKLEAVAKDQAVALQKPFYMQDLLRKIQEMLHRLVPLVRSTSLFWRELHRWHPRLGISDSSKNREAKQQWVQSMGFVGLNQAAAQQV